VRALVTGVAGFIGSHLTESLLGDGWEVIGVDCFNDNYGRATKLHNLARAREWDAFDFVPIDLSRGGLDDLVDVADVVFHLAAEPGVRDSWNQRFQLYVTNNIIATQHLLDACRRRPDVQLVYSSSSSVYGQAEAFPTSERALPRPFSPYGVTKLSAEQLCTLYAGNFGLRTVSLRFFSVYGPRQRPDMAFSRFCSAAIAGEQINVFGDGLQTRDFTFVADIVAGLRLAGSVRPEPGSVYNIGGGSQASVRDALEIIQSHLGTPLNVSYGDPEKGDVRNTSADISLARAELGFAPAVTLADGLMAQLSAALATAQLA